MRLLFFVNHDGSIRNFEAGLTDLLDRGHSISFALSSRRPALMSDASSIDSFTDRHQRASWEFAPKLRGDPSSPLIAAAVGARDYLRYLTPEYRDASKLRERAANAAPPAFVRAMRAPLARSGPIRAATDAALRLVLGSMPPNERAVEYIRKRRPDAVLFTPLVGFGLGQYPFLRAARSLGITTALLVHSWDNLTNKGLIHEHPDLVLVWNESQAAEATSLHGIPASSIVVTGAHSYDHWFTWQERVPRAEFCARLGLDPERPLVLYVCSSSFIAPDEPAFVARWVDRLRVSADPLLSNAAILVRPHPQNLEPWRESDLAEREGVAVWPAPGSPWAGARSRSDYYDSIHHSAAVVGINTSALIESAIQHRPVLTIVTPEYRDAQEGTLHFEHVAGADGILTVASSFDEHENQLRAAIERQPEAADRADAFLARFVRPHGLDQPAVPRLVDAVESLDELAPRPLKVPGPVRKRFAAQLERLAAHLGDRLERSGPPRSGEPLSILFFMFSINYDRLFEASLRALLQRGHRVHVAFDVDKLDTSGDPALFESLLAEFPHLTWGPAPLRGDHAAAQRARALRLAIDYQRYLDPRFAHAFALRRRARARTLAPLRRLVESRLGRSSVGRRLLGAALRAAERSIPLDAGVVSYLRGWSPDIVLVTPLIDLGSNQGEYIRAARRARIPTALAVASWDNLTNKGVIRDLPDLTLVWNDVQRREAVELHGAPPESVAVTGAHTYDHWFAWSPSRTREQLCVELGLDPADPVVLYVGSSKFIAPQEGAFVGRWLAAVRSSPDERVRRAGVIVRPHPANPQPWALHGAADDRTVVWPAGGAKPTTDQAKRDYFDSLFHADAVVGINTSALVEAAIVGRPVLTVLDQDHRGSQEGTLHFDHLVGAAGVELLSVAGDLDEHCAQLSERTRLGDEGRGAAFVEAFVRPGGVDRPASDLFAAELEALAKKKCRRFAATDVASHLLGVVAQPALAAAAFATRVAGRPARAERRVTEPGQSQRILFVMDHPGFLLHFDQTVGSLLDRGHRVDLAFMRPEKWPDGLETVRRDHPLLSIHQGAPYRSDDNTEIARGIRRAGDYLHYLDPALSDAAFARAKWRDLSVMPPGLRWLKRRDRLGRRWVRLLLRGVLGLENALPSDPKIEAFIRKLDPDALLVTPLVDARSDLTDYVKSAHELGIPAALCVASWDNLSSKGLVRIALDRVTVWNELQRRECIEFHAVPEARIAVTGAQGYDRWFERTPAKRAAEFRRGLGLPAGPFILFVGSTRQKQDLDLEPSFLRRWVAALRASDDPVVRDLPVLVRPHPTNRDAWATAELDGARGIYVWQELSGMPLRDEDRSDYYDALYHSSAVFGINSTAMVEAAILGKPVHTVALPETRMMQRDLIHYGYMVDDGSGFLREFPSFAEHVRALAAELRDPEPARRDDERFVSHFVRPHGLGEPAMPRLVDAIEGVALLAPARPRVSVVGRGAIAAARAVRRLERAAHQGIDSATDAAATSLKRTAGSFKRRSKASRRAVWPVGARVFARAADDVRALGRPSRRWLKRHGFKPEKAKARPPKPAAPAPARVARKRAKAKAEAR